MEYMRRHPDVYIDLRHTQVIFTPDLEKYTNNLIDSLAAGTSEDIMILDYFFPMRRVAAADALADLDELIEADSEVKRSDFFENILDAMKYENGLYVMPLSFSTEYTLMNKEYTRFLEKPLEEYKTIDYRDMFKAYDKALAGNAVGDKIYLDSSSNSHITSLYALDLQSLDYDAKTVNLYNEDTKNLLDKAASLPLVSASEASQCRLSDFFFAPAVKTLFAGANDGSGGGYDCLLGYEDFKYSELIPLADFNGNVHCFVYQAAAISRNCAEPDTAWDFLKFLMGYSEDDDESGYDALNFYQSSPIQIELFKRLWTMYLGQRYDSNLKANRTPSLPKDEAIEKGVAAFEEYTELATRLNQFNDSEFQAIWNKHLTGYANKTVTATDMLKALEQDLRDLLAKY